MQSTSVLHSPSTQRVIDVKIGKELVKSHHQMPCAITHKPALRQYFATNLLRELGESKQPCWSITYTHSRPYRLKVSVRAAGDQGAINMVEDMCEVTDILISDLGFPADPVVSAGPGLLKDCIAVDKALRRLRNQAINKDDAHKLIELAGKLEDRFKELDDKPWHFKKEALVAVDQLRYRCNPHL